MKMNKKGVTLIELIIVFVIIAIGAVLTIPNLRPWIANYRLRSATRDITSTLRTAQMRAVSYNADHRVSFDLGVSEYLLQVRTTQSAPNDWIPTWDNARIQNLQQKLPTGISIVVPGNNPVTFSSNSSSNGGTIQLSNTRNTRTITVLPSTGRITTK